MNINEKQLGDDVSLKNYRPSEAEKAVLINLDNIDTNGEGAIEQDIINIPTDVKSKHQLTKTTLDGAFDNLIKLAVLRRVKDGGVVMSEVGRQLVDRIKQQTPPAEEPPGTESELPETANQYSLLKKLDEHSVEINFLRKTSKN